MNIVSLDLGINLWNLSLQYPTPTGVSSYVFCVTVDSFMLFCRHPQRFMHFFVTVDFVKCYKKGLIVFIPFHSA